MQNLNELKATIQGIRRTIETQSYRAAATITAPSTLFTKSRKVTYVTTLYESGGYAAAKAKYDVLDAMASVTDLSLDLIDQVELIYNVTATEKTEGAWSDWS
ncbi:MAG: hypothetical protein PHW60_03935 [Kiritimatiellae bacterium]|nr:hypothetical protein [Kiritimatiellia bacterium]